jgi:SAM-dependent methyltransferase
MKFEFRTEKLDASFWDEQYRNNNAIWDLGIVSPPLKAYIDQLKIKDIAILIPGAGNAYELKYLIENGFQNITIIDISKEIIDQLKKQHFNLTQVRIIEGDFFKHKGQYDLILEQTFFCALHPELRNNYMFKMNQLLKPKGKLVGLFFGVFFSFPGPPFGGEIEYYKEMFSAFFEIKVLSPCYNSIKPRMGTELFAILIKN